MGSISDSAESNKRADSEVTYMMFWLVAEYKAQEDEEVLLFFSTQQAIA